jgi:hypothetical protein
MEDYLLALGSAITWYKSVTKFFLLFFLSVRGSRIIPYLAQLHRTLLFKIINADDHFDRSASDCDIYFPVETPCIGYPPGRKKFVDDFLVGIQRVWLLCSALCHIFSLFFSPKVSDLGSTGKYLDHHWAWQSRVPLK